MTERQISPLTERVITDYSTLPTAYLEHLQRGLDEGDEQRTDPR